MLLDSRSFANRGALALAVQPTSAAYLPAAGVGRLSLQPVAATWYALMRVRRAWFALRPGGADRSRKHHFGKILQNARAGSADEALTLLANGACVDLVLTDHSCRA